MKKVFSFLEKQQASDKKTDGDDDLKTTKDSRTTTTDNNEGDGKTGVKKQSETSPEKTDDKTSLTSPTAKESPTKTIPTLEVTPPNDPEKKEPPLHISERGHLRGYSYFDKPSFFEDSLTYLVIRASPIVNDFEVLYPIPVGKNMYFYDDAKDNPEKCNEVVTNKNSKGETNNKKKSNGKKSKKDSDTVTGKEETRVVKRSSQQFSENEEPIKEDVIYHAIYSKTVVRTSTSQHYHSVLKQVYNDFQICEAKLISPVGEPTIAIRSEYVLGVETVLRRTGPFTNTWHFDFEDRDYRWKPATMFAAKECDLICQLIEYDVKVPLGGTAKKKSTVDVAVLKRPPQGKENWDVVGDLTIFKAAWDEVREPRALEVVLVLGCLIMLDVIETP